MATNTLFGTLTRSLRPAAISAFGLFTSPTLSRASSTSATCTRFLVRPPSEVAPRECPTPLILLRAQGIGGDEGREDWKQWASMFAERGYTAVEVDVQAPTESESAKSTMDGMVAELAKQIRLMSIPFPPILIASQESTLVTQSFISNHPASGLVLISPTETSSHTLPSITSSERSDQLVPEFTFEPHFPVLVVSPAGLTASLKRDNRLVRDFADKGVGRGGKGVSFLEVQEEMSDKTRIEVERWMDHCGF